MREAPCKGCQRRKLGCHGSCADYRAYKDEAEKKTQAIRAAKAKEAIFWEYQKSVKSNFAG